MIKEIIMQNIKGQKQSQALSGRDIIIGPNGIGKTTRLQALGISILGYVPGNGKLPAETFKLASGNEMTVGLRTERFTFTRTFSRSEKTNKDGESEVAISQKIDISPSKGEKKAADKEARIAAEIGNFPVMMDFNEFLNISDAKRRDFIYNLSPITTSRWTREDVQRYLDDKFLTLGLKVNNFDQFTIMADLISKAMEQFPADYNIQDGLQSMFDWAKAKQTHWNSEKKNAEGAVKKLADMKNQLAETDRNIASNKEELEKLQQQLVDIEGQLARDNERKRIVEQRLARITEMEDLISKLQVGAGSADTTELDEQINQHQERIKEVDYSAAIATCSENINIAIDGINFYNKSEREEVLKLIEIQAEKGIVSRTIAAIEERERDKKEINGGRRATTCVIHPSIGCLKDFSPALSHFRQQLALIEEKETSKLVNIQEIKDTRAGIEKAKAEEEIKRNQAIRDQSKQNSENDAARKAIANLEKQKAEVSNNQTRIDDQVKLYQEELQRLRNQPAEPIAPTDIQEKRRDAFNEQIKTLKAKLDEQEKAKITLSNLKSSMIDSKTSAYYAQCSKDLAEALGAKGIQGELVKEILEPIRTEIQSNLNLMGITNEFFFRTESDTGKEVFQFGWKDRFGDERNFDALSTGQQLLLLISMLKTFLDRANPPLKVLALDNIEHLDQANFRRVLVALNRLDNLDNIILAGVKEVPGELEGWTVSDLGVDIQEEVRQSA
jgi:exonuclease SbcC